MNAERGEHQRERRQGGDLGQGARSDDQVGASTHRQQALLDALTIRRAKGRVAGLTVAIVALPLSMAIAIASGVGPERGLFTTIIGGFLVSLLGGSRYQIGGPAGAFIVLVAACATQIGIEGLLLATLLSGIFLSLLALMRAGSYVRFIPYPVTLGFTAGIAVIIFVSQIKDLLGLTLPHEPGEMVEKLRALWQASGSLNGAAVAVAAAVRLGAPAAVLALVLPDRVMPVALPQAPRWLAAAAVRAARALGALVV